MSDQPGSVTPTRYIEQIESENAALRAELDVRKTNIGQLEREMSETQKRAVLALLNAAEKSFEQMPGHWGYAMSVWKTTANRIRGVLASEQIAENILQLKADMEVAIERRARATSRGAEER